VRTEGDDVYIQVKEEQTQNPKRKRQMAKHDPAKDSRVFVVIGGGAAGSAAVESVRASGFEGRLVWFMKEKTLPLDRIRLSKQFGLEESAAQLRTAEFYKEFDIEAHIHTEVIGLDHNIKEVRYTHSNHTQTLKYDSVLVCTGGSPLSLRMEGSRADNVFLLRTLEDAKKIGAEAAANPKANVVVVGSNFIGMECAGTLSKMVGSVTVLARGNVPFKPFGQEIGETFLRLFEKNGVNFRPNSEPKQLKISEDGYRVTSVVTADGTEIPADFVVCGVGVEIKSSTAFVIGGDNFIEDNGAFKVDQYLRAAPGFFAAGDNVVYPDPLYGEVRIEHWAVAGSMGKRAGANLVAESKDQLTPYNTVPYFWTLNFGKGIRYTGYATSWDEIIFDMEPNGLEVDTLKFAAFYIRKGKVAAVATVARDPLATRCAEFLKWGKMPDPETIRAAIKEKGSVNHLFL
jgi:NADPH-dependent 2,4-dienoyl-CoA reductase/sulfur reductase-like enzyme